MAANKDVKIDLDTVTGEKVITDDPYALVDDFKVSGPPWVELDTFGKIKRVTVTTSKFILLLGLLYMFICSLSFLSSAFRLLGGKTAGEAFSSNTILSNPVGGLMLGVVATVLLQSSSTTTSIVVAMVSSGILKVRPAIPIIMGANIGTSVTNTIVAVTQLGDRQQFRRAFAGATVHDMFNILSVIILLPIEVITGYLYYLSDYLIEKMELRTDKAAKKEFLKKITKPFTNLVIQIDKKIIEAIARGDDTVKDKSLIKFWCDKAKTKTESTLVMKEVNQTMASGWKMVNTTQWQNTTTKFHEKVCDFLFHDTGMSDSAVGAIMLVCALIILCVCLFSIVKILHSLLRGQIAYAIRRTVNNDFPKPFGFLTGYVAIIIGACLTMLVQSSSIFTSAITPLVGLGIVTIERVFPLTLGANIGTTITSILAALASSSDRIGYSLQIALCHLFFNITGIILFYPIPAVRKIPIELAKGLGNITANYRWFALLYIFLFFFIVPAVIFGLSLAGWKIFTGIMVPVAVFILFIIIVNVIQNKRRTILPKGLQDWSWAPKWCRSLQPYDDIVVKVLKGCKKLRRPQIARDDVSVDLPTVHGKNNVAYANDVSVVDTRNA